MISIERVSKSFRKNTVVSELSIAVNPGEIVGFLGPNGAGKTTTIKMTVGLLKPDSGRVLLGGHDIARDPMLARAVLGYIPDVPNLFPRLTGWETLDFFGDAFRLDPAVKVERGRLLAARFGLDEWMGKHVETYSHGTQQKLAWATALLHEPSVLILDEPTVGLDPANARLVKDIMLELRGRGCAILMSSHLLPMVEEIADRVVMIRRGQLVADGTLATLYDRAAAEGYHGLESMFLALTGESASAKVGSPERQVSSGGSLH